MVETDSSEVLDFEQWFLSPEDTREYFEARRQRLEEWLNPLLRRVMWEQEWVGRVVIYAVCEAYRNAIDDHEQACLTMDELELCHCTEMRVVHETCEWAHTVMIDDLETDDPLEDPRQTSWWCEYQGRE